MHETWSCNPPEFFPQLTATAGSTYVDSEAYKDDPDSLINQFVKDTNLGSEENPYSMFGAFVIDLHSHLTSRNRQEEMKGHFLAVDVLVDDEDTLAVDCEPHRWNWRYDPAGYVLEWEFWLKEEFLPFFVDGGNSIAGRIAASPSGGKLGGIPPGVYVF